MQIQRGRAASEIGNSSTESLRSESSSVLSPPPELPLNVSASASASASTSFSLAAASQPISITQPARPTSTSFSGGVAAGGTSTASNKQLTYIGHANEASGIPPALKASVWLPDITRLFYRVQNIADTPSK